MINDPKLINKDCSQANIIYETTKVGKWWKTQVAAYDDDVQIFYRWH